MLLLTSGLIPFPTAVLSKALQFGNPADATVSVVFYAAVGCLMCLSWLLLFHLLSINPHLLEPHVESTVFPQERHRALFGVVLYVLASGVGHVLFSYARTPDLLDLADLLRIYERRFGRNTHNPAPQIGRSPPRKFASRARFQPPN